MFDRELYTRPFLGLVLANAFFWFSVNLFLPVLPIYYHNEGMSDYEVGLAIGSFSVGALAFRLYTGKWVDRYGPSPVLLGGALLSVAAIAAYPLAGSLAASIAVRLVHGAGISGFASAALTMASFFHHSSRMTEALAVHTLLGMIGSAAAAGWGSWIYAAGGFTGVVVIGAAATTATLFLFPRRPLLHVRPERGRALPISAVVTHPGVYVPTLGLFAVNLCFGALMTFMPLLLLGRGVTEFNEFYIAYAVTVVASRFFIGRLTARFTAERLAFVILPAFGAVLVGAAWAVAPAALVAVGAVTGLCYGLGFPVLAVILTSSTEPANRGTAFGFYAMAIDAGFGMAAVGMGAVAEAFGHGAVFLTAGIYTLAYAVLYLVVLRPRLMARLS